MMYRFFPSIIALFLLSTRFSNNSDFKGSNDIDLYEETSSGGFHSLVFIMIFATFQSLDTYSNLKAALIR